MNASQKSFWDCHGNGLVKTTPTSSQKMCLGFKSFPVYCRFFPNPQLLETRTQAVGVGGIFGILLDELQS